MHDDRALLAEVVGLLEHLLADRLLRHHALDEAAAVADLQEVDLAARATVVQPATQSDGLSFEPGDFFDIRNHQSARARSMRCRARRASSKTAAGLPVLASSIM